MNEEEDLDNIIEVKNLTKEFDDLLAVDQIDFKIKRGEIFGLLGPNGAGKTTTVRMMTGVFSIEKGSVKIDGFNMQDNSFQAKKRISVVPELANAYQELTAKENIMFIANLYGLSGNTIEKKAERLLAKFGLSDRMNHKVKNFSKGMRQRVNICMALVNAPEIIFMDEPTSGLDVESRRLIRSIISDLKNEGKTILLTTHDIPEASNICNKIAIMDKGKIAAIDTPDNLKDTIQSTQSVKINLNQQISFDFNKWEQVNKVEEEGNSYRIYTDCPGVVINKTVDLLREKNIEIKALNTMKPSLEDVFVELTKGENNED